jgi:3-deoxy-D-manno-octulosonic-acid transferase
MRFVYNVLFTIFFTLAAPFYFWKMWRRGNWRRGFGQRFGRYDSKVKQSVTNSHVLWLHAVSVGEVNVCTHLIRALEPRLPNAKMVVSTTTSTGMGELQRKLPRHIGKIYYPIDFRRAVSRAMRILHPQAIILVEAEIWPNFLARAAQSRIPVFLVNARMSEKSFRGYQRFAFLFRPLFRSFAGVGVQNETDAARMRTLGCRAEAVHVVGNLKFDAVQVEERPLIDTTTLLRQLGVPPGAPILIGGSTHAGEEAMLADLTRQLRRKFPELFLVLAPRHFERGKEVGQQLHERGIKFVYRTEISPETRFEPGELECLLLNTTGELKYFYEPASLIFIGKSLTAAGGQNPIEPAALAKPILFGPNMQNFQSITDALLAQRGAVQVQNAEDLRRALSDLLQDEKRRIELGRNAVAVVRENQGSIERTVEMILRSLPDEMQRR